MGSRINILFLFMPISILYILYFTLTFASRSSEEDLAKAAGLIKKREVESSENCGPDNFCISDLQVTASFQLDDDTGNTYVVGGSRRLPLLIHITNMGELALEPRLDVTHHPSLIYVRPISVEELPSRERRLPLGAAIRCSSSAFSGFTCHLQRPMSHREHIQVLILMDAAMVTSSRDELKVNIKISSRSATDLNPDDNNVTLHLKVLSKADLEIKPGSFDLKEVEEHPLVGLNVAQLENYHPASTGNYSKSSFAIFTVENNGPSDANSLLIFIYVPVRYNGKNIVKLVDAPVVLDSDMLKCHPHRSQVESTLLLVSDFSSYESDISSNTILLSCLSPGIECDVYKCDVKTGLESIVESKNIRVNIQSLHLSVVQGLPILGNETTISLCLLGKATRSDLSIFVDSTESNNIAEMCAPINNMIAAYMDNEHNAESEIHQSHSSSDAMTPPRDPNTTFISVVLICNFFTNFYNIRSIA